MKNVLIINKKFEIEIHFNNTVKYLASFFDQTLDKNMKYLVSIDLSNFDTSSITDMRSLFYGCSSLKSINFSNINTSSLNYIYSMFYGCSSLESIDMSNFDTSSVIGMGALFYGCSSLKSINLFNFNTSSVVIMKSMFEGCSSLKSVNLSNFNTSSVVNMEFMFDGCSSLRSINLSTFNTISVKYMSRMFFGCNSLNYLDLSNFNMVNCDSSLLMFYNISSIKYINLYNFHNYKYISEFFKDKNKLYVCQKDNIITNPNVYNCCNFNFEINKCDYISKEDFFLNINLYKSSSSAISIETIIGLIIGIVILIIIIIIIICICKKKKNIQTFYPPKKEVLDKSSFNINDDILTVFEYEPEIQEKDSQKIIIIFQTTNQYNVQILIDPNKAMTKLIKFYFDIIKRQDLFGDNSILFIKNGKLISHKTKDLIKSYFNGINNGNIIVVDDSEDKICPNFIN